MKKFLLIGLFLISANLFSQNLGGIKGNVSDNTMNNEPLLMANVQVKGHEEIVQTNFNGNFKILNLSAGTHTLIISYLGYETIEVPVAIEENVVSNIVANLNTLQFDLGDVAGLDTASTTEEKFSVSTEDTPKK
ncbi:MAG: carboxypeptidase-like regulatory domain-containing protein [Maribacter sp.]